MNINEKLQHEDGTQGANPKHFRSLVGGLNYLIHTRPDIAYSVSLVSRYLHSPTKQHFGAAKRILRYVASTVEFGIWYSKKSSLKLIGFTDSDWAGSLDDKKMLGNIFSLGSGAVTWSSKKQETVALSSSEAEYTAATSAARQVFWLRKLLADLGCVQTEATAEIYCDNRAAIAMRKNPVFHARTKHIDVQHHFIHQLVSDGKLVLKFRGTNEQVAYIFTKALPQAKHDFFRMQLGVCNFESRRSVE
ncbi:hypothetical protein RND81_13G146900 [Saponaria officinalis]|uniref:Uncharacterized protein n=1 Tax=Saponaria officinalis TaxID=3572 RepID=A0AAW1H1H1_SAPOF